MRSQRIRDFDVDFAHVERDLERCGVSPGGGGVRLRSALGDGECSADDSKGTGNDSAVAAVDSECSADDSNVIPSDRAGIAQRHDCSGHAIHTSTYGLALTGADGETGPWGAIFGEQPSVRDTILVRR